MNESKPYPDEVCSNTDELDLPSWCVETPEFSVDVIGQLCLEVCFLFLLFFGLHQWFRHRRDKRVGLERLKQLEHQPSVKGVLLSNQEHSEFRNSKESLENDKP